jgi:membrane-bound serine protease (ClpP class)
MADYVQRGVAAAQAQGDTAIVLELNTPGGAIDQMQTIVTAIRQSSVPVVVYVSPRGAMAGSAGTLITLAGHAAAMAPDTAIGAASPVGSQGEDLGSTLQTKEKEILKALVRSLTADRPPEAVALAESTIEEAKAVSAVEAKQAGLVDILAADRRDLLLQLDGRTVKMPTGEVRLQTGGAAVEEFPLSLTEVLLGFLTNPNIVFLLLVVGVQAIFIEFSHPGIWVPGFVGAVCIALALYGMGVLSVNWFGLAFILLAFFLFFLELQNPTHGMMAVAGTASFIAGTLVLFNSNAAPFAQRVSVPLVVGVGVLLLAGILAVVTVALRARNRPVMLSLGRLAGMPGVVKEKLAPRGSVQANGELWTADSESGEEIEEGAAVEVVRVAGLRLVVRKKT